MRKRARWMNSATDPVLEFLNEHQLALPLGPIVYNLGQATEDPPSRATVHKALKQLEKYGLVRHPPSQDTYYEITSLGESYLSGEVDAAQIDPVSDS
jgi:Fe2+ or Zn2+ uptake regulation protein